MTSDDLDYLTQRLAATISDALAQGKWVLVAVKGLERFACRGITHQNGLVELKTTGSAIHYVPAENILAVTVQDQK